MERGPGLAGSPPQSTHPHWRSCPRSRGGGRSSHPWPSHPGGGGWAPGLSATCKAEKGVTHGLETSPQGFSSSAGAAPLRPGPGWAGACAHPGKLRPPGRGGRGVRGHRRLRPRGQASPGRPQAGRCPWAGRGRGHVHAPGAEVLQAEVTSWDLGNTQASGACHGPDGAVSGGGRLSLGLTAPRGTRPCGPVWQQEGWARALLRGHGLSLQTITQRGEPARPPASPCLQLNALLAAGPKGEGRPRRQEGQSKLVPGGTWPGGPARPPCA